MATCSPRSRSATCASCAPSSRTCATTYGYPSVRYLQREELRAVLDTDRYLGALYDSNSGHLHPLNYTLGLAAAAASRAACRSSKARARCPSTRAARRRCASRRPHGEVRARHLVLCGNVYLGDTAPSLASKIMAVATYIVATEPLGEARARQLIAQQRRRQRHELGAGLLSPLRGSPAAVRRPRELFGPEVLRCPERDARAHAARCSRSCTDVRIEYAWGGEVDITLNRAPHFGRLAPNVYFLQGFSGHGIALTGIAGKLVAEAIAGTAERFDVFARIPHGNFPGGMALRRPALVLAMLYYRIRDLL